MNDLLNYDLKELYNILIDNNIQSFKTKILLDWIYKKFIFDFEEMTNFSKNERLFLKKNFQILSLTYEKSIFSQDKKTEKFLFKTKDNNFIETVLIQSQKRNSICVSSQVGCALNCSFCATAKLGFKRNLTTSEILSQILYVAAKLNTKNKKITNIVFMGMGEPLLNYNVVIKTIKIINDSRTLNIGSRHITISTSGIIEGIKKLSKIDLQVRLAISLNSPFQEIRQKIMPVSKKNTLNDLLITLQQFQKIKNKKITFEYVLMKNINMAEKDVKELSKLLGKFIYNLNIIKYNPIFKNDNKTPDDKDIKKFIKLLNLYNIKYSNRLSRGAEISAGCGQLGLLNK